MANTNTQINPHQFQHHDQPVGRGRIQKALTFRLLPEQHML